MDFRNLLVLGAFFINFFLSILILLRAAKTNANRSFIVTAFGITFWCLTMFFYRFSDTTTSILFARLLYFFPTFIPTSFLLFGLYFANQKVNKYILYLIIGLNFVMAYLALFSSTIIQDVIVPLGGEKKIVFGWTYYWMYIWYIPGFFTASYIVFFKKYLSASPYIKLQILYILGGMSAASIPAMITNLNLPTLGYFELNWVGQIFTIFWIGGVAYAIIKHRLMDIKLIVARALVYALLLIIIGGLYSVVFFVVPASLLNIVYSYRLLVLFSVTTFIVAFSFQTLRLVLEKVTDKVLYKDSYDTSKFLYDLALIMATTLELKDLENRLLEKILSQMRISRGVFILIDENNKYNSVYQGYDVPPIFNSSDITNLISQRQMLIFEELSEGQIKKGLRDLNVSAVCYLGLERGPIGLLVLGEKLSGDIYTSKDIDVLGIAASEVAVAIQNAQSFDKIKRFNITLSQEVEKATGDLKNANNRLQDLDKLKDDFVSIASHELRTPMTAIRSYAWMALHRSDIPLSQKLQRYLYRVLVSTERLINLVNDMLNLSRIEAGRIEVTPKSFNILELIKEIIEDVTSKAREKRLQITLLEHNVPPVFADSDKVREVLLNLIGNSLKFVYPGGLITIDFFSDGKMVEISVKDNGAGISKEDLARLFHKFSRLENSYTAISTSGGTGLGLYISKNLIELMHGKIWASSDGVDKGSTFTFSLPVATKEMTDNQERYRVKPRDGIEAKPLESVAI